MNGLLTDKVRLLHILDANVEVEKYLHNVTKEQFFANSEKRFATIKQIEIVGEACSSNFAWITWDRGINLTRAN